MADRPSNVELIFGDPFHKRERRETERHNRASEDAAKERIQKDRDIAESRQRTARDIAEIRSRSSKDRMEHDQIVEERKQAELDWKIERGQATDAAKQASIDRRYAQKDKELAQRQLESQGKLQQRASELEEKQFEFDNPSPAKLPEDRIETTDPVTGKKTVIHVPKGEIDRREAAKQASDAATSAAQEKANRARNWWQKLRNQNLPFTPPEMPPSDTSSVPSPTRAMRPPPIPYSPTMTGTNESQGGSAPQFVVPPGTGRGIVPPPMSASPSQLPGIGRQLIIPPLPVASPPHDEPGGPYDLPTPTIQATPALPPSADFIVPDSGASNAQPAIIPITVERAPAKAADRVEGKRYKSSTGKIGTWTKDGWQIE